jgi:peptidoglycan-N-acetylglucosamine deacetylase
LKIIQPPYLAKKVYPEAIWRFSVSDKSVFLTFDDGPHPVITKKVLDILDEYDAKATFFCVGQNVEKFSETFNLIIEKGHAVGNHTFNHLNGWKNSLLSYARNIEKAKELIPSNLFRPPYGRITNKQLRYAMHNNYKLIMWDVLTYDWTLIQRVELHAKKILKAIQPGSIIVFHDSEKAERNMLFLLKLVLSELSQNGYSFKSIVV